jgi:hypothetical protein
MSTYVDKAINPKTNEPQLALFVDDYFGSHRYGIGFKDDGTDASLYDTIGENSGYTIYPQEQINLVSSVDRTPSNDASQD